MDIARLSYQVDSSDLDKANAKLDKNGQAAKRAEGASGRLQRAWTRLQGVTKGLVAAKGLLVAGLVAITARTARYIQEVALMSQQIGVSTEALSSMRYAAEQMANVGSGQFDMALRRMTRRITEAAAGGGPAAAAIDAMGLSARELARLSPDEQFRRIADAMRGTSDQGTRLRHTMALMDTEGMPLVNMLSQGADAIREMEGEAAELGLTLGQDTIRQAEEFRRTMARMRAMVQGMAIQVAQQLLPTLNEFAKLMNSDGFKQGFSNIVQGAVTAAQKLAEFAVTTANVTKFLAEEVAARYHGAALDDIVRVEKEADRIEARIKRLQTWMERGRVGQAITGSGKVDPYAAGQDRSLTAPRGGSAREKAERELNILLERQVQLQGSIRDFYANPPQPGPGRKTLEDFFNPANIPDFDFDLPGITAAAEAVDDFADRLDMLRDAEIREEDARLGWLNRIDDMVARVEGPVAVALLDFRRGMAELDAAFRMGIVSIDDYQRAAEAMGRTLGNVTAEMDAATGKISVSAEQAGRNIQSFLGQATYDVLDGKFRDIADSFSEMIKRMMAELAASKMLEMLGGWATGYSGAGSGWINQLGSILGGGRRHGGPVRRDRMYEVNEGGIPELLDTPQGRYLLPGSHGNVTPLAASAGGGGAMATPQININVAGNANVESATARQNPSGGFDIDVILRQVDSHIAGGIATGTGQTGRAMKSRYGLKEVV